MAWAPEPVFSPAALSDVVPDIRAAKNTIPHHEAKRLAPILLAVAARHLAKLSDDVLRPLGLRRL